MQTPPYPSFAVRPNEIKFPDPDPDDKDGSVLVKRIKLGNPLRTFDRVILFCWDTEPLGFMSETLANLGLENYKSKYLFGQGFTTEGWHFDRVTPVRLHLPGDAKEGLYSMFALVEENYPLSSLRNIVNVLKLEMNRYIDKGESPVDVLREKMAKLGVGWYDRVCVNINLFEASQISNHVPIPQVLSGMTYEKGQQPIPRSESSRRRPAGVTDIEDLEKQSEVLKHLEKILTSEQYQEGKWNI